MDRPLVLIVGRFDAHALAKATHHPNIEFRHCDQWDPQRPENTTARGLIIRSKTEVDHRLLAVMPQLEVIVTATSGFDHVDLQLTEEKSILVGHVPDAPVQSVVELFLLLALSACRKQKLVQMQMAVGDWQREALTGSLLQGKTLGLIGCGRIGRAVAATAHSLGLRVLSYDPYLADLPPHVEMVGFDELLRNSDVLSLHVPKTPRTRHMLNKSTMTALHTDVIIVNTSRGQAINEAHLIQFLQENPQAQAALDVFESEPLTLDSALYKLPNAVLSPHIGASTDECLSASSFQAMKSIERFFAGQEVQHRLPPQTRWWEESLA